MSEHCRTCGAVVRVEGSSEGTHSYLPEGEGDLKGLAEREHLEHGEALIRFLRTTSGIDLPRLWVGEAMFDAPSRADVTALLNHVSLLESNVRALSQGLDEERERFPADGLWLVDTKPGSRSMRLISRELPDPIPLVEVERRREAIVRVVETLRREIAGGLEIDWERRQAQWTYPAAGTVAGRIIRELAGLEEAGPE